MGQYNILLCDIHFYVTSLYCFVDIYIPKGYNTITAVYIVRHRLVKNTELNRFTRTSCLCDYNNMRIIYCRRQYAASTILLIELNIRHKNVNDMVYTVNLQQYKWLI